MLGHPEEAVVVLHGALSSLGPSLVPVRSGALTDLAVAYAQQEEVEHACELLARSLELSAGTGLVAHAQRVVGARQYLARWQDTPAVSDLDERLRGITWAPV